MILLCINTGNHNKMPFVYGFEFEHLEFMKIFLPEELTEFANLEHEENKEAWTDDLYPENEEGIAEFLSSKTHPSEQGKDENLGLMSFICTDECVYVGVVTCTDDITPELQSILQTRIDTVADPSVFTNPGMHEVDVITEDMVPEYNGYDTLENLSESEIRDDSESDSD